MNNISIQKHITPEDLNVLGDIYELMKNKHDEEALAQLKLLAAKYPTNVELRTLLLSLVAKTVTVTPLTKPTSNSLARQTK
jgi:hypothetical protein